MSSDSTLIRSRFMYPVSDRIDRTALIEDGYLVFSGRRIVESGQFNAAVAIDLQTRYGARLSILGGDAVGGRSTGVAAGDPARTDATWYCHDAIMLPGFVKAHGHDDEAGLNGMCKNVPLARVTDHDIPEWRTFIQSGRRHVPLIGGHTPLQTVALKARLDDIYYGITSSLTHQCFDHGPTVQAIASAAMAAGTRVMIAVGAVDRNCPASLRDQVLTAITRRLDSYHDTFAHSDRVSVVPGPADPVVNSPQALALQKRWATEHGAIVHCHSSEDADRTERFTQAFGKTPIEYMNDAGFLDDRTVVAHQVHSTPEDLEIIRDRGVKIVHNPLANAVLGSGMPPILEWLDLGIDVAVATDGFATADHQNMLAAGRLASQYQRARRQDVRCLPAPKILELLTIEPARMLGLDAGCLDVGKDADIILFDLGSPNMVPSTRANVIENLVWSSNGSEISCVIAGGVVVLEHHRFKTIDAPAVLGNMRQLSEEFLEDREGRARG